MMPHALFRLSVTAGTRLTLAALYGLASDVDPEAVRAWEDGRSNVPPFIWEHCSYEDLQQLLNRGRGSVAEDLALLKTAGVIRRARRDGRDGLELLGTRPAESGPPDVRVRPAGLQSPKTLTPESVRPDSAPAAKVRPAGPARPPGRTSASARPDSSRTRAVLIPTQQHPDECAKPQARRGEAANDPPSSTATSSPTRILPRPASPALQAPARALLLRLAREFGEAFVPCVPGTTTALESRRMKPDADTLRRLAELLTAPDDVDPGAWLERQVAMVSGYVRDYAAICGADPEQAHHWGGQMLEAHPLKGQRSAWETTTRIVDRWREAQAAARQGERELEAAARAAEDRAVVDRLAVLEQLARDGEPAFARQLRAAGQRAPEPRDHRADHAAAVAAVQAARAAGRRPSLAEVNAAVAATPALVEAAPPAPPERAPLTDEDEEQLRRRGRGREAWTRRTEVDDDEIALRTNRALLEARRAKGEAPLTTEEAETIRRRVRGEEEATGTC